MAEKLISKRQAGRGHTFDLIREKQAAQAERDAAVNEFATALQSAGAAATSGPAAVSGPSTIRTPELDNAVGNVRPTGETWEDTNALARQLDAEKAREAERQKTPERNVAGGLTTRQFEQTQDGSQGYVGRQAAGGLLSGTAEAANYFTNAALMAEPVEALTNTERLRNDAMRQEDIDRVYQEYLSGLSRDERDALEITGTLPSREEVYAQRMMPAAQSEVDNVDLSRRYNWDLPYLAETEKRYEGVEIGAGKKLAGDVARTVGQMAPAMALNFIPGAGHVLSSAYLFSSAAGAAMNEALANGATNRQAMDYGDAVGLVELATEKMFDGLGGLLGKGAADDIVESVIGKLTSRSGSNALRNALRLGFGALGEGAEEGVSALADPILQSIYNNKTVQENYKDLDWGDVGYQIMLGALSGGVLGSLGMVNGQFRGKNAELDQRVINEVVNDVLTNTPEGRAVVERADSAPVPEAEQASAAPNENRMFHQPVNRSGANQILFDPAQRAAFEQETGVSLSNMSIRDAANLIMEYSRQSAETGQTGFDVAYPIKTPPAPQQFNRPLSRSEAQRVANDPTLRALFEQETGRTIPGKKYAVQFIQNVTAQMAEQANAPAQPTSPIAQTVLNNEQQNAPQTQATEPAAPAPAPAPAQQTQPTAQTTQQPAAPQGRTTPMRVEPAPADADGTRLSTSVPTVQNAPSTSPEFSAIIDKTVSENGYRYIPITNNETVQKATQRIQRQGWERARANWTADVRSGKTSAEMMATGALLYNNAVNAGDLKAAAEIMAGYVAAGTNTAQALQARKIIQSMQPEMRLYMIDSTIARLSENLAKKLPDGINISQELRDEYMRATTDEQRDEIVARMQKEVADQIPSTFKDKWTALRYVNMLGNFRTQARNILGNTTMAAITSAKNAVQTLFESVASVATGGRVQRTTSLFADRALVQAAREYYNANSDAINGEGKYSDNRTATGFMKGVEDQRRIFKTGIMEGYRRATNWAMTRGDTVFIGARFARTLAGYLQVNGMDAATFSGIQNGSIQPTAEQQTLIDKAVNYATQEAQEATFHDNNTLSTWISQIGRKPGTPKFARLLSEGIMPFRKTPANVLIRAEEYSPLGFVNATVKAVQAAKGTNNVTANDVVNSLSKAFTGTGIFFLGMLLRNAGWLSGHEDDDKQKGFNDLQGEQEYALNLPGGKSITIDWMSPASVPLFLGVQMMDAVNDGGFELKDLEKVFTSITDPMIQMSMLQGVNDTLSNVKYAENNLVQVGLSSAMSYLTQGLTNTMLGQLERTVEDRRTTTYVDKDSNLPAWAQRAIGKAAEKVPIKGADFQQVEYLDAWGRPDMYEENGFARAINNFVNPGYVSQTNSTEVDNELQRLYDAGAGNVFPQRISMSDKIAVYDEHGQKTGERQLTADEYVQVQREAGQAKLRMVKDLMASPVYDGMSDEARADAISAIYQYANYEAIRKVEPSHEDKYSDISGLSNIPAYFAAKEAYQDATANRWNRDYEELDNVLESFGNLAPDVQKALTEKVDNFGKAYDAYQGGVSAENWYKAYDAKTDLKPYGDNKSVADWQKYQAMANVSSDKDMDVMLQSYMEEKTYESYMTARNDGLSAKDWADARAAAGMLTPPEGKDDAPDALKYQAMAQVLDDDGMDAMMHATLEEGSYDKYVAARDAGISAENWANAMASTVGLAPLEGHKDVTDAQKWQAMAGTVSDRDMDALMRAYLSEGTLRNYTDVRNAGISAQLWADTRAAVAELPVLDGRKEVATFQALNYIGSNSDLSNKEKDALMGLYLTKGENGKMSTYEKYLICRGAGFAPQHLAKFLEFNSTYSKKAEIVAAAVRYGFTEKNAEYLYSVFHGRS